MNFCVVSVLQLDLNYLIYYWLLLVLNTLCSKPSSGYGVWISKAERDRTIEPGKWNISPLLTVYLLYIKPFIYSLPKSISSKPLAFADSLLNQQNIQLGRLRQRHFLPIMTSTLSKGTKKSKLTNPCNRTAENLY